MAKKRHMAKRKLLCCIAETSVIRRDIEFSRGFGVGQFVDPDETIGELDGKKIKLGADLRPGCFEEVDTGEIEVPTEGSLDEKYEGE